jgi:hypothetical protein
MLLPPELAAKNFRRGRDQMAVLLKNFDVHFSRCAALAEKFQDRLVLEGASPKVWTKARVEDLKLVEGALGELRNAIAELANQVRDD